MLLLIDNYDSFVYNLARYFVELGCETRVVRNDVMDTDQIRDLAPQAIVISPGPCSPSEAGNSIEIIRGLSDSTPILGVCLGHQAIAAAFGGKVVRAPEPVHGRSSLIVHCDDGLYEGLPNPLQVGRYHSLIVEEATLPPELIVTSRTNSGIPMGLQHRSRPLYGVQFHPESVLTHHGRSLLANFLRLAGLPTTDSLVVDWKEPSEEMEEATMPVISW